MSKYLSNRKGKLEVADTSIFLILSGRVEPLDGVADIALTQRAPG